MEDKANETKLMIKIEIDDVTVNISPFFSRFLSTYTRFRSCAFMYLSFIKKKATFRLISR